MVAIVVEAVWRIGRRALKTTAHLFLAAASFLAIYFLHLPFPLIIFAAAVCGVVLPRIFTPKERKDGRAEQVESKPKDASTTTTTTNTITTPTTGATRHQSPVRHWRRACFIVSLGLLLWLAPFLCVLAWRGADSRHAQLYLFFTKTAFVTFGGAYAVLAYVAQAASSFGWLTARQMIDGLALAETTPGPLIMVLQFVGFMAGWNAGATTNAAQTTDAIIAALLTTFATFLPCFVFVFLGAPYIERLRGNHNLNSALSGVTAAVVGVILNLAFLFGATVVFPRGDLLTPDLLSLVISVAAFVALRRFSVEAVWLILVGACVGLLRASIGK